MMRRELGTNLLVFALLVALGVATRWLSDAFKPELSNFSSIGATAMFAGYFFSNRWVALFTPLAVMVVSNLRLPQYDELAQMAVVYVALLLPVTIGILLRRKLNVFTAAGGSLASSVSFFLITNFPNWPFYNLHPHTATGVVESYLAGLPFFRNSLASDLFFTAVIFGAYWAASTVKVGISRRGSCAVAAIADVQP